MTASREVPAPLRAGRGAAVKAGTPLRPPARPHLTVNDVDPCHPESPLRGFNERGLPWSSCDSVQPVAPQAPCERVLLLEDDGDTLATFADVLRLVGVPEVRTARSIAEAERILAGGFSPCAVFLDLMLGADRGDRFAARLRADAAYRDLPLIAISASARAIRALRERGHVDHTFLKPFEIEEVVAVLWALCRGRRQAPRSPG